MSPPVSNAERIFGLDLVRALAICGVLLAHLTRFLFDPVTGDAVASFSGFFGVELFFVLSGFLIGGIVIRTWDRHQGLSGSQVRVFWIRRWFRTLPNYYLMLGVYAGLAFALTSTFIFSDCRYFSYFVFLQNAFHYHPDFFSVAWTLSIEEWFYLSFPLVLMLASKLYFKRKSRAILATVAVYMFGCLALRCFIALVYPQLPWDQGFRKIMPLRLDSIAIGVVFAYLRHFAGALWERNQRRFLWIGVGSGALLAAYVVVSQGIYHHESFFLKTFFFTCVSVALAMFLPAAEALALPRQWLVRVITHLSVISYSLYLLHPTMMTLFTLPFWSFLGGPAQALLIIGSSVLASTLLYRFYEKPATQLRDRFSPSQT